MAQYRKKPAIIDASQWFKHGDHLSVRPRVECFHPDPSANCKHCGKAVSEHGFVDTLEGGHTVCPADWIIEGTAGEFYPCKPDIFPDIYEKVEE